MTAKKLPTIAMTPMPKFGYDPVPSIAAGAKKHTLRKQRQHGRKEVVVNGQRMGIVLEFHGWVQMTKAEFLTDEFAIADGFRATLPLGQMSLLSEIHWSVWSAASNLCRLLQHFYGEVPATMWCNHFRVVQQPGQEDSDGTQADA